MSVYRGERGPEGCRVTVDGVPLDPRLDVRSVPAAGFEWGYRGGGPARLAFAILSHRLGDDYKALNLYRSFCEGVIAELRDESWSLNEAQIDHALDGVTEVAMTLDQLLDKLRGRE